MLNFSQNSRTFFVFVLTATATSVAQAQLPDEVMEAYVRSYNSMGKQASLMYNQMTAQTNARSKMITSKAEAQAKIMMARAAWITAVANAQQTNAKTMQLIEETRTKKLDNELKHAQTYYGKKQLYYAAQQEKRKAYYARKQELKTRRMMRPSFASAR